MQEPLSWRFRAVPLLVLVGLVVGCPLNPPKVNLLAGDLKTDSPVKKQLVQLQFPCLDECMGCVPIHTGCGPMSYVRPGTEQTIHDVHLEIGS